jgi:DNA polymerase
LAIVGEGPGESEVQKGRPFIGGSGRLLFDTLKTIGLNRTDLYTTNVVKRQISLSRFGNEKNVVKREELEKWIEMLNWELSKLPNLKTILIMGGYALAALLGEEKITHWRGSVVERAKLPGNRLGTYVCTINPAYAMRELKLEPVFALDIRNKLRAVLDGTFTPYKIETLINPSYQRALKEIRELKQAKKPTTCDIEGIGGQTACIGFANDPHRSVCINWRDDRRNRYSVQEEADILYAIQDLCDSHKSQQVPLLTGSGLMIGSVSVSQTIPYSNTIPYTLNFHTISVSSPHSIQLIHSTKTKLKRGKKVAISMISGGIMEKIRASL